jgi:hypothetical protein
MIPLYIQIKYKIFFMGNSAYQKINFEDMQFAIKKDYLIINTLRENEQHCLIQGTVPCDKEVDIVNHLLKEKNKNINIILYGKNNGDDTIYKKANQLISLGFTKVNVYCGGLFEWLLLQEIYGNDEFLTSKSELDILKYKPTRTFDVKYLTNY